MNDQEGNAAGPNQQQPEFYGKYTYDNVHQYKIEEVYPKLIAKIVTEKNRDVMNLRENAELVGDITEFLSKLIEMSDKYDSTAEITSEEINPQTHEKFTLESFAKYIDKSPYLPPMKVKSTISELARKYIVLMAKRASMRKARSDKLPFLLRVGQKLQFTKWTQEETDYLEKSGIRGVHRSAFMINHYRVIEDGEVHMLSSGDNKCLAEDEWVYTPNGILKANEIREGTQLFNGYATNIHKFKDELYELDCGNFKFRANGQHPIMILKNLDANKQEWLTVKEIFDSYELRKDKSSRHRKNYYAEYDKATIFGINEIKVGNTFAKLLGYLMSDGYFTEKQSVKFTNTNQNLLEDVIQLAIAHATELNFEIKSYTKGKGQDLLFVGKHGANLQGGNNHQATKSPLKEKLRSLGIINRNTFGKLQCLCKEELKEFISGYFNGDGSLNISAHRYHRTTTKDLVMPQIHFCIGIHEQQAHEFQFMLWRLGIDSTVSLLQKTCWMVHVHKWASLKILLSFLDTRKYPDKFAAAKDGIEKMNKPKSAHRETEVQIFKPIKSVKKIGIGQVIGWTTDPSNEIICKLGLRTHNSGKTGTGVRFLIHSWRDLNGFFRPYIEQQLAEGKYLKMDGTEYRKFEDLVPKRFRLKDRMILMDKKGKANLLATSPFPDLLYDEGNFTNINLKSLDPETVDETVVAFGARNKHPFVIYNYQNSSRPTLFLREKFNMWFHKIHIKTGFWLIRQRLVIPTKDPWLVKKLDDIIASGSDEAIYGFFKRHPYTMMEYRNMSDMPKVLRKTYELRRQKAQTEMYKAKNAESILNDAREKIAVELSQKIDSGRLLYSALDQELTTKGIKALSERTRIKNIISGLVTHTNILATVTPQKKIEQPTEG